MDTRPGRLAGRTRLGLVALAVLVPLLGFLWFFGTEVEVVHEELCAPLECVCETTTYLRLWSSTQCFDVDGERLEFLEFEL